MASTDEPQPAWARISAPDQDFPTMVLLVDDQVMIAEAIRRALMNEPDLAFHYCSRPAEAVSVATQIGATVILQDLVMPGFDGLTLVREYRANPATSDIPIIVLSSKEQAAIKVQCFAAGANDYLVKLPDTIELLARVRYHSKACITHRQRDAAYDALHESQQQLITLNLELQRLTRVDSLTGSSTRRYLDEVLAMEWSRGTRGGSLLCLLMIDIDNFKKYNDTYGHIAGDGALRRVAEAVRGELHRSSDVSARFGGEEFMAVLPMTPIAGARVVGERIRAAVAALNIEHSGSDVASHVTVSIGGAAVIPRLGSNLQTLMEAADQALYQAKHDGKNRVVAEPMP